MSSPRLDCPPPLPDGVIHVVGAAIVHDGRCLIGQRNQQASFPGLWEFPGGKVEDGEAAEHALVREIQEELGVTICVGRFVARGEAQSGNHVICLDVYLAELASADSELIARVHDNLAWVDALQLSDYVFAPADEPALAQVRELLAL